MVNADRMTRVDPITAQPIPVRDIKIAFDEVSDMPSVDSLALTKQWNIWDLVKAPGSAGLKQIYDYTDLLGSVAWLSVLVRKHKDLGLACLAQTVNVVSCTGQNSMSGTLIRQISPLLTTSDGVLKQTTYYP